MEAILLGVGVVILWKVIIKPLILLGDKCNTGQEFIDRINKK